MRLSDLRDKAIRDPDGKSLGRVHEVHCDGGRVTALICGPGSLIQRLTSNNGGRRIPWENVSRVEARQIVVSNGAKTKKAKSPSAARTRKGTRRPSAPRSKR